MSADLTLVDDALLVGVQVLDRVFDSQNVLVVVRVDASDHGGQEKGIHGSPLSGRT